MVRLQITLFTLFIFAVIFLGCSDKEKTAAIEDTITNIPDSAQSALGDILDDVEFEGSNPAVQSSSELCARLEEGSQCAANVRKTDFGFSGCEIKASGSQLKITGEWNSTYSSPSACASTLSGPLPDGESLTRSQVSYQLVLSSKSNLLTETVAHETYNYNLIPATGIKVERSGSINRVIVQGLRKTLTDAGKEVFEHSVISGPIDATGSRLDGTRVISSGTITIYNNLKEYTSLNVFNGVRWGDKTCCFPTAGAIDTTYSGKVIGTSKLSFSSTCGQAQFTDINGETSEAQLLQCKY